jgi:hypothetical protein
MKERTRDKKKEKQIKTGRHGAKEYRTMHLKKEMRTFLLDLILVNKSYNTSSFCECFHLFSHTYAVSIIYI